MERVIVDDPVSAVIALSFEKRIEALEQGGMGKDEEGNIVVVKADQKVTSGTEIGGITIGEDRTAFYAPEVEIPDPTEVVVTPLVAEGTKIANIKVDDTLHALYAPSIDNKIDAPVDQGKSGQVLATNGKGGTYWTDNAGGGGSGGGSTVTVTPHLTSGVRVATINVDGNSTTLYAPNGDGGTIIEGGGAYPLLNSFTLTEDVSSIIISEDSNGNELNLAEGFYIEAEFELANENPAKYFNVQIGNAGSENNVTISSNHGLNTGRFTYADVYAVQIAPNRWLVETHTKNAKYDPASGVGNAVGNLGYSNWNGFNDPPATVNRVVISYNTSNFGRNTKIKLYGR